MIYKSMITDLIKEAMRIRKVKAIDLARHLNITRGTIFLFLNGREGMRQDNLEKVFSFLEIELMISNKEIIKKGGNMFEVLTGDCDVSNNTLTAYFGGNGDIYIAISNTDENGIKAYNSVRINTSGGNCPTNIKIAAAELARSFEDNNV